MRLLSQSSIVCCACLSGFRALGFQGIAKGQGLMGLGGLSLLYEPEIRKQRLRQAPVSTANGGDGL